VSIVSISVNPLMYLLVGPVSRWLSRVPRLARRLAVRARLESIRAAAAAARGEEETADSRFRAVVVGYGPIGQTLVRLLKENGIEPTVIEMNLETVRRLRRVGVRAVYGDAAHPETLREAGVHRAASLFLTASGMTGSGEVVRIARELNPDVHVLARTTYLRERPGLFKAGADAVFAAEGEIAMAMSETVLRELGASPDQIDRDRERVRTELFGEAPPPGAPPEPPQPQEEKAAEPAPRPDEIPTVAVRTPASPPPPV
jgi:CPA2 family monovalent cation:H+ antiporter-2